MIMKKIWRIVTLIPLLFLLTACASGAGSKADIASRIESQAYPTITWGVKVDTNLFGFYNIKENRIEGFDIDMAKEITRRIAGEDAEPVFVEVTSKTRIPLLKNGNVDALIATMTISEERKKQVDFSQVYFDAGQAIMVSEDSDIQDVTDLTSEHTVLAVKGSTSADRIKEAAPEANILELENYSETFTALKSGQGDAMTTDNAILLGIMEQNPGYRLAGSTFTNEPYGIAVNKGQEDFLAQINQAIDDMVADGTYQEIYTKWFGDNTESSIAE